MEQSFDIFRDKVAIVTGGASGIGWAVSKLLTQNGAKVIIADLNLSTLNQAESAKVQTQQVDVSKAEQIKNLVEQVVQEHGRIDYIFNNAGFAIGSELADMTVEQWDKIIDVNLKGVIYGVTAAYPQMIKQGYGHIVNTASLAGLVPSPGLGAYCTTKHGVVGLSEVLRQEAVGYGVKVSVLCPGFINTRIFESAIYNKTNHNEALQNLGFKLVDVEKAAQLILQGVAKNKAIITFPLYAPVLWWLQRLVPGVISAVNQRRLKQDRARAAKA